MSSQYALSPFSNYPSRAPEKKKTRDHFPSFSFHRSLYFVSITFHRSLYFVSPTSRTYTASLASKYESWMEKERDGCKSSIVYPHKSSCEPSWRLKAQQTTVRESSYLNGMELPMFVSTDIRTQGSLTQKRNRSKNETRQNEILRRYLTTNK
jgi:hypothetical protein